MEYSILVEQQTPVTPVDYAELLVEDYRSTLENLGSDWEPQDQNEDTTEERRFLVFHGSNRGRRIGEAIIAEAQHFGWQDEGADMDSEFYHETTDEAIGYLNALLHGTSFSFYLDGDFFFCETRDKVI